MDTKMMEAIAAHQAAQKQAKEEAKKKEKEQKKRKGGAANGFHSFSSFDAKASQAVAHGKRMRQEAASDDSDSQPEHDDDDVRQQMPLPAVDWSNSPAELQAQHEEEETADGQFVAHFIRFVMGRWRSSLREGVLDVSGLAAVGLGGLSDTMRAIYESEASLAETQDMLAPLIQQLEAGRGQVDAEIMKHLGKMISLAAKREYKEAMSSYVEITIGRKKWNNAVMFGEAKHNKGFNMRRVKRDEDNKFDVDETVKKYIQAIRRMFNFAQLIRPNEDVSKHM